ncbi:MAG: SWIM zinc finger family protein [Candidatus Methanofastidiosia archaeon]
MNMRAVKEDEIREVFSDRTYSRGLKYFERGHVDIGVKKGENLIGMVQGSAPHPYRVRVGISDKIHSECTCPVGYMCKHGVALLLQWIHEEDSFIDVDSLMELLGKRSKEELLEIIGFILGNNPKLAIELQFLEEIKGRKINLETISKRLQHLHRDLLDYYAESEVVRDLENIKALGDTLARDGRLGEALEVYLLLIEDLISVLENGVEDVNDIFSDFVMGCVRDFCTNAENLDSGQKDGLLFRILNIVKADLYDLETEEMLYALATRENMQTVEGELLKEIRTRESSEGEHYEEWILDILVDLYQDLGMENDVLRMMKKGARQGERNGLEE